MTRPLKIGPDGLVEFASNKEVAHLNNCLREPRMTRVNRGTGSGGKSSSSNPSRACPLCGCQVREDRIQTHVANKCPRNPNRVLKLPNLAAAKVKARMEKNLEDRQKAYGPGFTPDGLPEPAPISFSELKKQSKPGQSRARFIEARFTEHDAHPRFEGGIRWKQGGSPGLGKRR